MESSNESKRNEASSNLIHFEFQTKNTRNKQLEDRIVVVDDLYTLIGNEDYRNSVKLEFLREIDRYSGIDWEDIAKSKTLGKIGVYGVCDGHCGMITSEFVSLALPFELSLCEEISVESIKTAINNLHDAVINWERYSWEAGITWCSSGTTISIAIVKSDVSYLFLLGDSPIFVINKNYLNAKCVFKVHGPGNKDCRNLVMTSKTPMLANANFIRPGMTLISNLECEKKGYYDKLSRVGISGLNCWGSIGDSINEPHIFNLLIEEVNEFKRVVQNSKKKDEVSKYKYKHFVRFIRDRPSFDLISKHIFMIEESTFAPKSLEVIFSPKFKQDKLEHCPIRRDPEVTLVKHETIGGIFLVSDGVATSHDADFIDSILKRGLSPEESSDRFKHDWSTFSGDDRSGVFLWFQKET